MFSVHAGSENLHDNPHGVIYYFQAWDVWRFAPKGWDVLCVPGTTGIQRTMGSCGIAVNYNPYSTPPLVLQHEKEKFERHGVGNKTDAESAVRDAARGSLVRVSAGFSNGADPGWDGPGGRKFRNDVILVDIGKNGEVGVCVGTDENDRDAAKKKVKQSLDKKQQKLEPGLVVSEQEQRKTEKNAWKPHQVLEIGFARGTLRDTSEDVKDEIMDNERLTEEEKKAQLEKEQRITQEAFRNLADFANTEIKEFKKEALPSGAVAESGIRKLITRDFVERALGHSDIQGESDVIGEHLTIRIVQARPLHSARTCIASSEI